MSAAHRITCFPLADGAILRLIDRQGATVSVMQGRAWITQDWDPCDRIIDAGEQFELNRPGKAIVQAFGPSCVAVVGPQVAANVGPRRWRIATLTRRIVDGTRDRWSALALMMARRLTPLRRGRQVVQC